MCVRWFWGWSVFVLFGLVWVCRSGIVFCCFFWCDILLCWLFVVGFWDCWYFLDSGWCWCCNWFVGCVLLGVREFELRLVVVWVVGWWFLVMIVCWELVWICCCYSGLWYWCCVGWCVGDWLFWLVIGCWWYGWGCCWLFWSCWDWWRLGWFGCSFGVFVEWFVLGGCVVGCGWVVWLVDCVLFDVEGCFDDVGVWWCFWLCFCNRVRCYLVCVWYGYFWKFRCVDCYGSVFWIWNWLFGWCIGLVVWIWFGVVDWYKDWCWYWIVR